MPDRRFYVYVYLDPSKLPEWVPIYVGKGTGARDRRHRDPSKLNDGTFFHNKLKKLIRSGEDPQPVRLLERLTEAQAFSWEVGLIESCGRRKLGTGPLCNITDGGDGVSGLIRTPESLMTVRMKGPMVGDYKGVSQLGSGNFAATIGAKPKQRQGVFRTPEEAARAYDEAAVKAWGRACYLNFPGEWDGTECLRGPAKGITHEESMRKAGPHKGEYKGVRKTDPRKTDRRERYQAAFCELDLGIFHTPEEAARAYDEAAVRAWGRTCYLNFPAEWDGTKCLREHTSGITPGESGRMLGPQKGDYKGVCQAAGNKTWYAVFKSHALGSFYTPEEAARAYDEAAVKAWGRACYLNFPGEWDGTECLRGPAKRASSELSSRRSGPVTGKYKGIAKRSNSSRYQAVLCGKHLGDFRTPKEAARARDEASVQAWGRDCYLNFPEEWDGTECLREPATKCNAEKSHRMTGPLKGKYKGVNSKSPGKYDANITLAKKQTYLKRLNTEKDAAKVYDQAVIEHWGQGWLNFPTDQPGEYTGFWDENSEHYQPDYLGDHDA